jgi:hypothetical protein
MAAKKPAAKKAPAKRASRAKNSTAAQGNPHEGVEQAVSPTGAVGVQHESFAGGMVQHNVEGPTAGGGERNRRVVSLRAEGGKDAEEVAAPEPGKVAERTVWAEVTIPDTDETTFILLCTEGVMVNPADLALLG